jgi:hypothetical protein
MPTEGYPRGGEFVGCRRDQELEGTKQRKVLDRFEPLRVKYCVVWIAFNYDSPQGGPCPPLYNLGG